MVLQWNGVLTDAVRADRTQPGPTRAARNTAVVELAVFDAVNGIDHTYRPYLVRQQAPGSYSKNAAAAEAAYEALGVSLGEAGANVGVRRQSLRSATTGSRRAARSAGVTQAATAATTISRAVPR